MDPMNIQRAQSAIALVEQRAADYRRATNAQRLAHAQLQLAHEELRAAYNGLGLTPSLERRCEPTPTIRLADEELYYADAEA